MRAAGLDDRHQKGANQKGAYKPLFKIPNKIPNSLIFERGVVGVIPSGTWPSIIRGAPRGYPRCWRVVFLWERPLVALLKNTRLGMFVDFFGNLEEGLKGAADPRREGVAIGR